MAETPNLFPGLSPDDLAKLRAMAGSLEALPDILNRLSGYAADLSEADVFQPALVLTPPMRARMGSGEPAPLSVRPSGELLTCVRRTRKTIGHFTIDKGATTSNVLTFPDNTDFSDLIQPILIFDDMGRAAAEVMSLQMQPAEEPESSANWWVAQASVLAATIGVVAPVSSQWLGAARWRFSSAVAVGARRDFLIVGGGG